MAGVYIAIGRSYEVAAITRGQTNDTFRDIDNQTETSAKKQIKIDRLNFKGSI